MKKSLLIPTLAILLIAIMPSLVHTVPPLPMTVYGYVFIHKVVCTNVTAPQGLYVHAKMDTTEVSNTTTESNGYYVIAITGPAEGTPIDLWVQDINITRITLQYYGILALNLTVMDTESPTITPISPTPGATVTSPLWINATLYDKLSINTTTITLTLNTTPTTPTYNPATGLLYYQTGTLTPGLYIINITAKDLAENQTTTTWNFTIPTPTKLYLVVRGMNDAIYYRSWDGTSWGGWTELPGATTNSPAAAVLGNNLHIVVKGLTGEIWHGYVDLTTSVWSGWSLVPGATPSPPTLTASATKLYLVVRGMDNRIYYNSWTSATGWEGWTALTGATTDRCAAAVLGGNLHIVVKGLTGEIWHSYVNLTTGAWSGWSMLSGATPSTPELTASATKLYLIVRGMNNAIYYRSWDGASWGGWTELPGATTNSPAAAVLGNNLHIVVKGLTGEIWHGYVDLTTSVWSGWSLLSGATPSTPELAA